jgi:phenylacetate-CoA ligase
LYVLGRFDALMMRAMLKRFPQVERLARQLIACYPLSARLGPGFWEWYAFLQESEGWSTAQLEEFQFERLRELLPKLARTSPFYARRLADVRVADLRTLADLQAAVPPLARQEFAAHEQEIRSTEFRAGDCFSSGTSGTTGSPLQFYHRREHRQREWASICHQWKRVGFDPVRSKRVEFRGLTPRGALYQDYPEQNMVRVSILDLRRESLPRMGQAIAARQATFYHGYPSALYLLAREILDARLPFPQPEAILLASEMVYDFQLEQIQAAFPAARLFAHYGCAEATVLGAWCEHRRVYHVLPQYSLVEVQPGTGEIIGTNLFNDINGFVRYRMTDTAGGVEALPCPACRRPYVPIITGLDGRQEDFLYSRERGWIAPAIVTYPLKALGTIVELQFHQKTADDIGLTYVARRGAVPEQITAELREIEAGLRKLAGNSIRLQPRQVDEIPRGPTGKYKWITSSFDPRDVDPRTGRP